MFPTEVFSAIHLDILFNIPSLALPVFALDIHDSWDISWILSMTGISLGIRHLYWFLSEFLHEILRESFMDIFRDSVKYSLWDYSWVYSVKKLRDFFRDFYINSCWFLQGLPQLAPSGISAWIPPELYQKSFRIPPGFPRRFHLRFFWGLISCFFHRLLLG